MRFDTPIYFQSVESGKYDPKTGNYGEDIVTESMKMASVTCAGVEALELVYGGLKQGSFVVRLQSKYEKPFDRIRIGSKQYYVDFTRQLRTKQVYIVSEVQ